MQPPASPTWEPHECEGVLRTPPSAEVKGAGANHPVQGTHRASARHQGGCQGLMCFRTGSPHSLCCSVGTQEHCWPGSPLCWEQGPPTPPSLSHCFSGATCIEPPPAIG